MATADSNYLEWKDPWLPMVQHSASAMQQAEIIQLQNVVIILKSIPRDNLEDHTVRLVSLPK